MLEVVAPEFRIDDNPYLVVTGLVVRFTLFTLLGSTLLSLLHLGIRNIYIGPTLPAFLSPGVLNQLVEGYALTPTSTPGEDLKKILG